MSMNKDDGMTPKGRKIVAALAEFRDALAEGAPIGERFTVRTVDLDLRPRDLSPDEVKQIRKSLGLSQPLFARFLGVDVKTVRSWEQGLRVPAPIACRFLGEIASDLGYWKGRLDRAITRRDKQVTGS